MSEQYLAEVRIVSFNFAPKGWALCNGQLMPINQNPALFALLGTTYGGDGRTTFALPDLRGRMPIHVGAGFDLGQQAGEIAHTITANEMPTHTHLMSASANAGDRSFSTGNFPAMAGGHYGPAANLVAMNAASVSNVGGSQAHENRPPLLALNFVIAIAGIFPSPN